MFPDNVIFFFCACQIPFGWGQDKYSSWCSMSQQTFSLQVNLNVKQGGKRLEHQGIRIEFVGQIGEHNGFIYDYVLSLLPWLLLEGTL